MFASRPEGHVRRAKLTSQVGPAYSRLGLAGSVALELQGFARLELHLAGRLEDPFESNCNCGGDGGRFVGIRWLATQRSRRLVRLRPAGSWWGAKMIKIDDVARAGEAHLAASAGRSRPHSAAPDRTWPLPNGCTEHPRAEPKPAPWVLTLSKLTVHVHPDRRGINPVLIAHQAGVVAAVVLVQLIYPQDARTFVH